MMKCVFIVILIFQLSALASVKTGAEKLISTYKRKSIFLNWDKKSPFITGKNLAKPFWLTKPSVFKRVKNDRLIPVMVAVEPLVKKGNKKRLKMVAGAWINVPLKETFNFASKFNNYKRLSKYVKEIKVYEKDKLLYSNTSAYKYFAEFLIQTYVKKPENSKAQIQWLIVGGLFEGMVVVFDFKDVGHRKTQIAMSAYYEFSKLPLAKIFIEFGLEVIMQKAGAQLRSLVEADFNKPRAL